MRQCFLQAFYSFDNPAELKQPFSNVEVTGPLNSFPEAVVVDPVIADRRKSWVPDIERRRSSVGQLGTFSNESEDSFYQPIDAYEGKHRYDPKYSWDKNDEKRLVRKFDWKICTWACLVFFALQLDRANIVQAVSDGMLENLHITSNDYNYGQMIFYCSFLFAELPSQLVSKKLGPDNWIPVQMVSWSLVASCQAFVTNRTGFFICRFLLGLIEGGFIPDVILYLSYFYTSTELPKRLSFFWVSYRSTNILSAFLTYGILRLGGPIASNTVGDTTIIWDTPGKSESSKRALLLDGGCPGFPCRSNFVVCFRERDWLTYSSLNSGRRGVFGWQWLFALEGTLTGIVGIISYFYLPPSPYQTASRSRGKSGWFTEHEEKIMANRILRDDPSKGDMHNRQGLSWLAFKACITDYHMWYVGFMPTLAD